MIIWDLVLIMKLLDDGVQPWPIVLMVQGLYTQPWLLVLLNYTICFDLFLLKHFLFGLNVFYRLFSCGTSKEGESSIVEWNESEGAVKRTYQGFRKRSLGFVQFDTTKNRYLAAGDDFSIKFWDMDNIQLLTTVDADGGLPVSSLFYCKLDSQSLQIVVANCNLIF